MFKVSASWQTATNFTDYISYDIRTLICFPISVVSTDKDMKYITYVGPVQSATLFPLIDGTEIEAVSKPLIMVSARRSSSVACLSCSEI